MHNRVIRLPPFVRRRQAQRATVHRSVFGSGSACSRGLASNGIGNCGYMYPVFQYGERP
jgi:hypothetical protein